MFAFEDIECHLQSYFFLENNYKSFLFYSNSFLQDIGELSIPEAFGYKWGFAQDFKHKRRLHEAGEIEFTNIVGDTINCKYHYFFNYYNAFVFFFPADEKKKSKTKIILKNV